jgi:hypothetical protein
MTSTRSASSAQGAFQHEHSRLWAEVEGAADSLFSHSTGFSTIAPQDLPATAKDESHVLMIATAILGLGIVATVALIHVLPG